jgi:hypothetical protein
MRKLISCFCISSIACFCILLRAESDRGSPGAVAVEAGSPHIVSGYVGGSPTHSFQVTLRLTDSRGHFEVVSWRLTKLTDQRSRAVRQSSRQDGVERQPRVPPNRGKVKDRTPFSRTYPIDLFLRRSAEEQHKVR